MTSKEPDYSKDGFYTLPTGEYLEVSGGNKYYYKDKDYPICHRENDLPAIEYTNGDKHWVTNGKLNRRNGPAVINSDGSRKWYLNGVEVTEEKYTQMTSKEPKNIDHSISSQEGDPAIEYKWTVNGKEVTEAEWAKASSKAYIINKTKIVKDFADEHNIPCVEIGIPESLGKNLMRDTFLGIEKPSSDFNQNLLDKIKMLRKERMDAQISFDEKIAILEKAYSMLNS